MNVNSIDFVNHGGVVIMTREGVQLNRVNTLGEYTTFEYICGLVQVHGSTITILLVYRPGGKPPTSTFFDQFDKIISKAVILTEVLLITGDVNVRLDRPMDLHTKSFMQIVGNYRLSQHVSDTTHSQGGTLDVLITRDDHVVKDLCVTFVPFSDHRLLQLSVNITKPGTLDIPLKAENVRCSKLKISGQI